MQALCPAPPLTTKQASNSSTVQGGWKRRALCGPGPRSFIKFLPAASPADSGGRAYATRKPTLSSCYSHGMKRISTIDRERDLILTTLNQYGGSRVQVRKTLGIHRELLNKKLEQYVAQGFTVPPPAKGVDCERRRQGRQEKSRPRAALSGGAGRTQGAALQTAKPSAVRSQRLCLHPPRPRRPPVTSHGIRQGVEPAAGMHQPDDKSIATARCFYAPKN